MPRKMPKPRTRKRESQAPRLMPRTNPRIPPPLKASRSRQSRPRKENLSSVQDHQLFPSPVGTSRRARRQRGVKPPTIGRIPPCRVKLLKSPSSRLETPAMEMSRPERFQTDRRRRKRSSWWGQGPVGHLSDQEPGAQPPSHSVVCLQSPPNTGAAVRQYTNGLCFPQPRHPLEVLHPDHPVGESRHGRLSRPYLHSQMALPSGTYSVLSGTGSALAQARWTERSGSNLSRKTVTGVEISFCGARTMVLEGPVSR